MGWKMNCPHFKRMGVATTVVTDFSNAANDLTTIVIVFDGDPINGNCSSNALKGKEVEG